MSFVYYTKKHMKKIILFCISILLCITSCEKDTLETLPTDLCGIWLGYGYWCGATNQIIPEEVILVEDLGNSFIRATKIIGDNCVGNGEITWTGNYIENYKNNQSYILTTLYFSGGNTMGPLEMEILDFNTMNLGWPTSFNTPINFKRATLEEINKLNLNIEGICKPQS